MCAPRSWSSQCLCKRIGNAIDSECRNYDCPIAAHDLAQGDDRSEPLSEHIWSPPTFELDIERRASQHGFIRRWQMGVAHPLR
jgi:hypothetical protein